MLFFLAGCSSNVSGIDTNEQNEMSTSYNAYLYSSGSLSEVISADNFGYAVSKLTDNADRRLAVGEFVPIEVKLNTENYDEYVKWLSNKEVSYVYADLYDIENAYANVEMYNGQILEQKHQHTGTFLNVNELSTAEQIYDKIVTNSDEYLKTHDGYFALDEKYIKLIAEILEKMLSDVYSELSQNDAARIVCMLNDVTAVGIDSTDFAVNDLNEVYNARVTEEAVIMLDIEMMENLRGNQTYERTIAHEVAHLFQRMCPDHKIEGLTQIGSSQYVEEFDDTGEVNTLHFQWLYEAAAEQMSMDVYDSKTPLVYKTMVGYLNTLNLITLIRAECDEKSIVESQMSNDADTIYEVLGVTTPKEREEIVHMLYSICFIQTEREDFRNAYKEKYGTIDGQEITIKKIMKESVAQTMTKYFYKNLAEQVKNGSVTLQDIFYLINIFEAALSLHIVYDDAERQEYIDEAISFYVEAQDKFFEMIAEDSELDYENVVGQFEQYALVIETAAGYRRNFQFSWLKQEEIDYLGTVLTTNLQSLTSNMRNY